MSETKTPQERLEPPFEIGILQGTPGSLFTFDQPDRYMVVDAKGRIVVVTLSAEYASDMCEQYNRVYRHK